MSDTSDSSSEREPDATSGAPDGPGRESAGEERDEAFLAQASNLVKTLKQGVVVTGERVQETIEDAVRRGRMTRKDAHELAAAIVSASRRQTDELRHELELLLERNRARKGRGGEGESVASSGAEAVAKGETKPTAAKTKAKAKAGAAKAKTAKAATAAKAGATSAVAKGAAAAKAKPAAKAAGAKPATGKPAARPAGAKSKAKAAGAKAAGAKPSAAKGEAKAAPPFAGYDDLTATEVGKRLAGLSAAELTAVRGYEAAHAERKTVLAAVDRRLAA